MTHLLEQAWLNTYGICHDCGASVSYYAMTSGILALRPTAVGQEFKYWVSCDNDQCKNHAGEGVKGSARPAWEAARPKNYP